MSQHSMIDAVKKLHELELFDDLVLYSELNNFEQRIVAELPDEEQAFVLACVADAHYALATYSQSARFFEKALKAHTTHRGPKSASGLVNAVQLRYKLHQAYLKENRVDDAIRCLEQIADRDSVPKVRYALAKLILRHKRSTKAITVPNQKANRLFESIVRDAPEALFCRSYLISNHVPVPNEMPAAGASDEARAWLRAKEAESQHNYVEAAAILSQTLCSCPRYVRELANYYHLCGDRQRALSTYQRAHTLDPTTPTGMDCLAALLYKEGQRKELETLSGSLVTTVPSSSETFVAFGYLARLQHRSREAIQFAHKASVLASAGKQRSAPLLLKANVLLEAKRFKEADLHFHEALSNDRRNIDAFESLTRSLLMQTKMREARQVLHQAEHYLGARNPRVQFLWSQVLAEGPENLGQAIAILEEVTTKAPYMLDAVLLLAKLYDRALSYDKAVKLLQQHADKSSSGQLHRLMGDFLTKLNRTVDACAQYRQALSSAVPDPKALSALSQLDANGNLSTPNAGVSAMVPPTAPQRRPPVRRMELDRRTVPQPRFEEDEEVGDDTDAELSFGL